MNKLYLTDAENIHDRLSEILLKLTGAPAKILRTENGKPYIEGNPLYFSISHSGNKGVIAVCDRPVGVDLELYENKEHPLIVSRFSEREQSEITSEKDFLFHWTAREAFIKMKGETLAKTLKSMEYYGGNIYTDGEKQPCDIQQHTFGFGAVSVCIEK